MIPEGLYFAANICVLDEKIYDESYFKIMQIIKKENMGEEVKDEVLKILSDDEEKTARSKIFEKLKHASVKDKKEAIALGLDIAFVDDYWSDEEEKFFKDAIRKIYFPENKYNEILNSIKNNRVSFDSDLEITAKKRGQSLYAWLSKIAPGDMKEKFKKRYMQCLLSGQDYSKAINEMKKISDEDMNYAKAPLADLMNEMNIFISNLNESSDKVKKITDLLKNKKSEEEANVEKLLSGIRNKISDFAKESEENLQVSMKQKEIAAKYYTISFMGRTKAGKSTLHSVILGGINKEFIGVGKERTTRYNRIYKWKGIRIIDTPGIGAPGGKSDTEIARSIVDESDLICYVVTSDSIQETEFAFLKELKDRNKPIVILLNKKENLSHPVHKKKFLENPTYWYKRTDHDSLDGHLTRIKEYAEKYYKNAYFDIFPVQLMAAELSMKEENPSSKKKFYDGSKLQDFLDNLRVQILENGKMKRSQIMLNSSVYYVGKYAKEFEDELKELQKLKNIFEKNGSDAIGKIKSAGSRTASSLRNGVESIFGSFIQNDIRIFANDNYDAKKSDLDYCWKRFYKDSGFEDMIKNRIEQETEKYKQEIEEVLQEFSENLNFAFDNMEISMNTSSVFDAKSLVGIASGLVGVAGAIMLAIASSNPVGWVLIGIGVLGGLISGFLKSKQQKIKEAQDKLYSSLKSSFEENKSKTIDSIVKEFEKTAKKTETSIEKMFGIVVTELENLIEKINPLAKKARAEEEKLNKLYAARVLNFAGKKDFINLSDNNALSRIQVEHDFGKELIIKTDLIKQIDTNKITQIIQEDVKLEALV